MLEILYEPVVNIIVLDFRNDFDTFDAISCTDRLCRWKKTLHNQTLKQYAAAPLEDHHCMRPPAKKFHLDCEKAKILEELILKTLPDSALTKRYRGRHSPVIFQDPEKKSISDEDRKAIEVIFTEQNNDVIQLVRDSNATVLQECCSATLASLEKDFVEVCVDTKLSYSSWHNERMFRITGSTCYGLFTYIKNKQPNWKKKCNDHLSPKNFRSEFTEYGKEMEGPAREEFKKFTGLKVYETGLIVSKLNPWLAYSPDGVIFNNNKPSALLEIKCPVKGKTSPVMDVVQSQIGKTLLEVSGILYLKKKHKYYGQVQLGMAVLNVMKCLFVMYAPFDGNVFIITVELDRCFVLEMVLGLKNIYFSYMIHEICLDKEAGNKENH